MKFKQDDKFWPSYSDLMTSLFFIMLSLFILSYAYFKTNKQDLTNANTKLDSTNKVLVQKSDSLKTSLEKILKINELDYALQRLDSNYFKYNPYCKRHELKINIQFETNEWDLMLPKYHNYLPDLLTAGKMLEHIINSIDPKSKIKYILIIEGRAAKHDNEFENREYGTTVRYLSYDRARSLYEFWIKNGINFDSEICEVIIAGSGFEGQCRYTGKDEPLNKRFIIQIFPKIGEFGLK